MRSFCPSNSLSAIFCKTGDKELDDKLTLACAYLVAAMLVEAILDEFLRLAMTLAGSRVVHKLRACNATKETRRSNLRRAIGCSSSLVNRESWIAWAEDALVEALMPRSRWRQEEDGDEDEGEGGAERPSRVYLILLTCKSV